MQQPQPQAQPSPAPASSASGRSSLASASLRLTLLLAVALLLVGAAGGAAITFLHNATRIPTADDIAQRLCTAYQTQNYDLLLAQIDPTPVAPDAAGPFDDTAKSTLVNQLRALDSLAGLVTACRYTSNTTNPAKLQYFYTLTRAHTAKPFTLLAVLIHTSPGWRISRASNFIGAQARLTPVIPVIPLTLTHAPA